ncbi:uncharacterized protein LOC119458821 isoform X2 [Dermacentor silvarum]|uniref:uncharacterized protein LOC119458821 isoform X2 n=1 Tax=Dermacentor silvarum TaxID=543639 RepID=UPI0021015194|nr:uncharacterized protein LOC119458821 isoform X2 [Dermacentor silvarum]
MKFGLALVCVTILGYVGADDKGCPELDCKKEGSNCIAVKDDGSKCGRCSCNGKKESNSSDSKPEGESGSKVSGEDTRNTSTAATVAADASSNKPEAGSKPDDKSQSKPDAASQSNEGSGSGVAASRDRNSCANCPEHCMVTMFKGKCTGCVSVDDVNAECH